MKPSIFRSHFPNSQSPNSQFPNSQSPNSQSPDSQSTAFPFLFRPMREDDIPGMMEIERRSFPNPWPESVYRRELRYGIDSFYFVLQLRRDHLSETWWERLKGLWRSQRSLILGYVGIRLLPGKAHVTTIAVHPDWRGLGLGKYILLVAIEHVLPYQVRFITLEVRMSNRVAQNLYTDLGFQFVGVHPHYYRDGEDAWLMRLGPLDEEAVLHLRELRRAVEERLQNLQT